MRWKADARGSLESSRPETAAVDAYYSMLYAARAALSERDRYAKTHRGVWSLFGELFVAPGSFDVQLYRSARGAEDRRLALHYEAEEMSLEEAGGVVEDADRFVEAVARMLGS